MNVPGIVLPAASQARLDAFVTAPAHAVLLSGPKGIGKTHIAGALAAQLLGASPDALRQHAYYRVVVPKNGTISIEQIRELISLFRLKVPGTAPLRRAAVLEDAETMGTEAQNALLKLLEEPPADSILILTSSQPAQLLPTILSRTQLLQLSAPGQAEVLEHFIAAGYDEVAVKAAVVRTGTNIAETADALGADGDESDTSIATVKQVLSASQYERLLLVDGLAKQKDQATLFTKTLAMVATVSLEAAATKGAPTARWQGILQAAYTAQEALEKSGNTKLVLTELMLAL